MKIKSVSQVRNAWTQGRHRGREGRKQYLLCDAECESVSHVLCY